MSAEMLDNSVVGVTKLVTDPVNAVSGSILAWLTDACDQLGGGQYVSCYYLGGLAILLFVHYIFYILENLSAFETKAQTWKQALSEVRQFLQVGVIRWLIYFASMIGGLSQALQGGIAVTEGDLLWGMGWAKVVILVLIVNKACVLLTGQKNFGNAGVPNYYDLGTPSAVVNTSSIGYGPLDYWNVSVGNAAGGGISSAPAILNIDASAAAYSSAPIASTNKPWWVYVTWIQTVTDILLSNLVYPAALGFAGGKFAAAVGGRR